MILRLAFVQNKLQQANTTKIHHINDNNIKFEVSLHLLGIWPTVWRPLCKQNNSKSVYNNLVCSILCHSLNKIGLCWSAKKCDKYCSEEVNATPYLYIPNDGNSQHLEKSKDKNNNIYISMFVFINHQF